MVVTCVNCEKKYKVDQGQLENLKQRQPRCKNCGGYIFQKSNKPDSPKTLVVERDELQKTQIAQTNPLPPTIGDYKIKGFLGKGGMGSVYKGWDESLQRFVAIKTLTVEFGSEEEYRNRFLVEARALAKVVHPNITQIYSAGEENGRLYFAMEFVDGPSTEIVLDDKGKFSAIDALKVIQEICQGLRHAHQAGIIHRDIKPANLLIGKDGIAKITDFGIAKLAQDDQKLTKTGTMVGTPTYISPEQAKGDKTDFRSDIYSLGVTLYEFVMGEPPFVADSTMTVLMKHLNEPVRFPVIKDSLPIPPPLTGVIRKMMAKKPDGRYLTYDYLIEALSNLEEKLKSEQLEPDSVTIAKKPSATRVQPIAETMITTTPLADNRNRMPLLVKLGIAAGILVAAYFGIQQWNETKVGPTSKVSAGPKSNQSSLPPQRPTVSLGVAPTVDQEPIEIATDSTAIESMVEKLDDTTYRIFGTIRNLRPETIQELLVEVALVDEFDDVLSKIETLAEPSLILSGEITRFSIVFKNIENFEQHQITLLEAAPGKTSKQIRTQ